MVFIFIYEKFVDLRKFRNKNEFSSLCNCNPGKTK